MPASFMPTTMPRAVHFFLPATLALAALLAVGGAAAERSDRSQPMVVEADRDGVVDLQRQVLVYSGNVVISQGSMVLRAERVETRELPNGYRTASAIGQGGKQATWRQRRDGVDETVEGSADRIDYDGRADTLRFVGNAAVRRLRGSAVADEITGANIVWDNTSEVFRVEGGAKSPANPTGRVRAVLSPQPSASAPARTAPGAAPLAPSRSLGEPR
jgi:lipopolysaccharide export system protein LptA